MLVFALQIFTQYARIMREAQTVRSSGTGGQPTTCLRVPKFVKFHWAHFPKRTGLLQNCNQLTHHPQNPAFLIFCISLVRHHGGQNHGARGFFTEDPNPNPNAARHASA